MAAYLPMASLGMQAAGAAMGTVGSYYSARNTKSNLQLQANLADTNAQIAELGAQSALAQGAKEEQRSRLQTTALKKSQRVALAANGVDLGQGSAAEILTSTDLMGDIDANTIKANAVRNAIIKSVPYSKENVVEIIRQSMLELEEVIENDEEEYSINE